MEYVKNFEDFKHRLLNDEGLLKEIKDNPEATIKNFKEDTPLNTDNWIYRIVVLSLGLAVLSIIIGVIVLVASGKITDDKNVPTILTALGSAALGAMAGLLAPSPKSK